MCEVLGGVETGDRIIYAQWKIGYAKNKMHIHICIPFRLLLVQPQPGQEMPIKDIVHRSNLLCTSK